MRSTLLPLLVLATACSSGTTTVTPTDAATDVDNGDAGKPYVPAGTTQVPYLSADAGTRKYTKADQVIEAGKDYFAVLETDVGRIVLDLYETRTPITVNSFVFLALHHYYEGVAFHRVIEAFMAQTGDPKSIAGPPSTWGTGGPGYTFDVELQPDLKFDGPGILGMARGATTNSNGSQFFITLVAYPSLDQQYTVWGKVTEGLDVLPNIVRGEPPTTPTRISEIRIAVK